MGRQPCCDKVGLKRGPWTIEEDHKLMNFILNNGIQCWRAVPKLAGLQRCGKSCRLRWINYLRPDLKRGDFTEWEEDQIIQLHSRLGNRWSKIASHFPGRTDNEIKNHWNTRIKKRLKLQGLDPLTHKPVEQKEQTDVKIEKKPVEPDLPKEPERSTSGNSQENNEIKQEDDFLMNQETNGVYNINTYSPSFSVDNYSLNQSMGELVSVKQESVQQLVDDSVDYSMLSFWDCFNHLEDDLLFLNIMN